MTDEFPPHFAIGTRVRHDGRLWSTVAFATVVGVRFHADRSVEYEIEVDPGDEWAPGRRWWSAAHTREGS